MKKKLLSLVCVVLLVVGAVFGTYAYLTDNDTVTNTFTVGNVGIFLDEADTDEYGVAIKGAERVDGNEYKLIPGHTYVKDPTVTVEADSEPSYVRMIVTVENIDSLKEAIPVNKYGEYYAGDVFLLEKLCAGWDKNVWEFVNDAEKNKAGVYEFRFHEVVNTLPVGDAEHGTALTLDALFDTITVPGFLEKAGLEELGQVQIKVVAHAIQADTFGENAADAWKAYDDQHKVA